MKVIKTFNSILTCGLLLISIGFTFGQTTDERKLELIVQTGHSSRIRSVVFSPDGKLLASGSSDNTIKLWDIESGKELRTLKGHTSGVVSVRFSLDGKMLVSGSFDETVKLWDVESGKEIHTFLGHSNYVRSVVFSPDGKTLASGSFDKTIKLWSVESKKELRTLVGHSAPITSVVFSPDGNILASGSWDKTVKLWNVESGKDFRTISGQSSEVWSVAFNSDGKILVIESIKKVIIWNLEENIEIRTLKGISTTVSKIELSPDGKTIVGIDSAKTITSFDVESGKEKKILYENSSRNLSVAFNPNGKILAIGSEDKTIRLLDLENSQEINKFEGYTSYLNSPSFSPDGKTLVCGSWDNSIKVLDLAKRDNLRSFLGHSAPVYSVVFSPDGKTLVSGGGFLDGRIKLWDTETGKEILSIAGNRDEVFSVRFSPNGKILASGGGDQIVRLWDVQSGKKIHSFEGHTDTIVEVAFSFDGNILISASDDETIKFWDVANGNLIETIKIDAPNLKQKILEFNLQLYQNEFSNVIAGNLDNNGEIILYDKKTEKKIASIIMFDNNDWAIITPDGRFDASESALKLMHYSYGLEIINLEQLKEMYYEPGLLQKLLGYSKESLRPIVPLTDVKLFPEILEQNFDGKTGKLNLKLKSRGGGIGKTEVFVNGKRVLEDARDERLKQNPNVPIDTVVSLTVDISPSAFVKGVENQIKIITSNYLKEIGKGNIQSRGVELVHLDKGNAELELPTLYAIVGGVSDYTGDALDLRFAAKDAEDFSNALRLGANRLFCPSNKAECLGKINITTLSTARQNSAEQPTKENFKKAFANIAARAKPEDIFLVYLAGHGVTLGAGTDTYFYLTKEARAAGKTDLEKNFQTVAISSAELTDWLTPNADNQSDIFVKALKQVIILDTCAAGNFAREDWRKDRDLSGDQIRAMEFLKDKTGTFILMGSASNAVSYEANRYNQGLLTYALLEGIKGFALQKATNNVDVRLLFDYAEKRVPDLAKDMNLDQRPIIKQPSGNTFLIGQMTDAEKTKINLPQPKPLLLRPLLTNPETGDDDLKLIPELRKRFDAESSYEVMQRSGKGEPALIYIDDDSFPSAVRVTGTYTVEGETVRLKAFLRKDGKTIATLPEIVGKKEELVEKLLAVIRLELGKLN